MFLAFGLALVMVLGAGSVAASTDTELLRAATVYIKFDNRNGTTTNAVNYIGNMPNGTYNGTLGNVTGKYGGGMSGNESAWAQLLDNGNFECGVNQKNCSFSFWAARNLSATFGYAVHKSASYDWYYWSTGTQWGADVDSTGTTPAAGATTGSWDMWTWTYDGTTLRIYKNAISIYNHSTSAAAGDNGNNIGLGARGTTGADMLNGVMDEYIFWFDRVMTQAEVTEIYLRNATLNNDTVVSPLSAPVWVNPTPADTATNNTQVVLNASSNATGARYFVWFDSNPNPNTLVVNNASTGNYTTGVPGTTTTYYYKAQVWNATLGYSANTSVRVWTYDAVNPAITLRASNEFNAQNNTNRNVYDGTVNLNISFTDDNDLYAMSVNISYGLNGTIYYQLANQSLNGLAYNFTTSVAANTWPAGRYNVTLWVSDSHTAQYIPDYQVNAVKSKITFKTHNNNNVKVESREQSTITAVKEGDRYSFRVVFDDPATKARTFDVKTDCPITYKPLSGYKAHFVTSCDGLRGNWVDFEGAEGTPTVTRLDDYHYTVAYDSLGPDVTFRSIGGLNLLNVNYTFYVGNFSVAETDPIFTGDVGQFGLNLSIDPSYNVTANLTYNGSAYYPTITNYTAFLGWAQGIASPTTEGTVYYNWTVSYRQRDGNITTFNITQVQTVTAWSIIACGTPSFINWTQYDEENPNVLLPGNFEVEVTYWLTNRSNTKSYNATFTGGDSWSLCFTPGSGNFSANVYAQNYHLGGFTHRFYIQNATYSNTTTYYKLYNPNNATITAFSDLKITTRYVSTYGYFKNVYAQLQRLYVGSNVWRTVQYDRTGDFGLLFFDIKEQSTDYRLRYYDENNSLLLATDSLKFVCSSTVCELTQLLNPASTTTATPEAGVTVSYDNATSIVTVVWESLDGEEVTADITLVKRNFNGAVTVCSTSQTGAGGSFDCNATGYSGELSVSVDFDDAPVYGEFVTLGRTLLGSSMDVGTQALVTFVLMLTIIGFGLFSPVALVLVTLISLVVVYFLGTLTGVTLTFLILSAVVGLVIAVKVKQ